MGFTLGAVERLANRDHVGEQGIEVRDADLARGVARGMLGIGVGLHEQRVDSERGCGARERRHVPAVAAARTLARARVLRRVRGVERHRTAARISSRPRMSTIRS